jgi:formylglycine-generating enzyme
MLRVFERFRIGLCLFVLAPLTARAEILIDTVLVGNKGNAPDQLWPSNNPTKLLFGSVDYRYRIGTTEVTNAQYTAFLNAKATSDSLGLYDTEMDSSRGGITRSGVSGSYSYATKANMADKPVNLVSWYDAIRFSNWLHNGQGSGDTETGAYTILGGTPEPSNGLEITRNPGAKWFLTSEDEWYKAAYYQPALNESDTDKYWLYPTGSNSEPTVAKVNTVGDIINPETKVANYDQAADWNGQNGNVTTVGTAGPLSESYYGTSDQGGNVWEWNESKLESFRGTRGGSFVLNFFSMQSSTRQFAGPNTGRVDLGFRVASVPEPGALCLGIAGSSLLWMFRKRLRK